MSQDSKFFNCSEEHEINYVAQQYPEPEDVKKALKELCKSGEIHYSTHQKVYDLLKAKGFEKK